MNKCSLLASVALLSSFSIKAKAEVPVIDPTSLVAQAKQLVETINQETQGIRSYLTQLQQYATQLQTYATDVEIAANFIHNPSIGQAMGLVNRAGFDNPLPINPEGVLSMINGFGGSVNGLEGAMGKLSQLNGLVSYTFNTNHIYTPTDGLWSSHQLADGATAIAATQGSAATILQDLQNHVPILQALSERLQTASNMKDVADAQAAIANQAAWATNMQGQLQAIQVAALVQDQNRTQRDNEAISQSFANFAQKYGGLN